MLHNVAHDRIKGTRRPRSSIHSTVGSGTFQVPYSGTNVCEPEATEVVPRPSTSFPPCTVPESFHLVIRGQI